MHTRNTVKERLQLALALRKESKKGLSEKLRVLGVRGSSRPSITSYLRARASKEPSLEFLSAAAKVLRVYEPWLIAGVGRPDWTRGDELRRFGEATKGRDTHRRAVAEDHSAISQHIALTFPEFTMLPESGRRLLLDLYFRLHNYTRRERYCLLPTAPDQTQLGSDLRLAEVIGRILSSPSQVLPLAELTEKQWLMYMTSWCSAILALLPEVYIDRDEHEEEQRWLEYRRLVEPLHDVLARKHAQR